MIVKNRLFKMVLFPFIGSIVAWEFLYFSFGEGFLLGLSIYLSFLFLRGWYSTTTRMANFFNEGLRGLYLYLLPLIPIILYLVTLRTAASWDVITSLPYIWLYLLLGIAWLSISLQGMLLLWSFSYQDDVLMGRNSASIVMITGAILGSSLIYAGANIGDGPGWWTVVFAGGLGTISWLLLGALINGVIGIVDQIVIERDLNSGIRFAGYLAASGLILARASGGNWTSFATTIIEFLVAWPVLLLVVFMILLELSLFKQQDNGVENNSKGLSILVAIIYVLYAVMVVSVLPAIF